MINEVVAVVIVVVYVVMSVLLLVIGWLVLILSRAIKPNTTILVGGRVTYYSVDTGVKRFVDVDTIKVVEYL